MRIQYISHEQNESNHKTPVKVKSIIILILGKLTTHLLMHFLHKDQLTQ